jgi:Trk K+ transport system NAD-binding subunit
MKPTIISIIPNEEYKKLVEDLGAGITYLTQRINDVEFRGVLMRHGTGDVIDLPELMSYYLVIPTATAQLTLSILTKGKQ